jgi:hypothetical protein
VAPPSRPVVEQAPAEPAPARKRSDIPVGGRAAARLERQASEAARKKSGKRAGPVADVAPGSPGRDAAAPAEADTGGRRAPRRVVQGLVAVVVVAVGLLGFWSFQSPGTDETSAQSPVSSSAPATTEPTAPVQETAAPTAEVTPPAPVGPVRAPITVLNSTGINGLAGDLGDAFTGGGWEVTATAESPVQDVATTTVYYTEGDAVQQQAAQQLIDQFPDVYGPVARYFDVPDQPTPGLVVVATGNWRP